MRGEGNESEKEEKSIQTCDFKVALVGTGIRVFGDL